MKNARARRAAGAKRAPIVPAVRTDIDDSVDAFSAGLGNYLSHLDLPVESVLVPPEERLRVLNNVPVIAAEMTPDQRQEAYYISKFVAACSVGLFDAAINFLWNETISNLRGKVAQFDLDYFLDSLITDSSRRAQFRGPDDLDKLEDWELIRGCLETGIISDLGFRHLDHIRNIRNYASAAHPNQNQLSGFQVLAWLETCIREVLSKQPGGGVIEVRKLLQSLRNETLSEVDVGPIAASLATLPDELARALLRAVFGMHTDPSTAATTRNNILLIAPALWRVNPDTARYEVGVKHETFAVNGEVARRSLAHQFLEAVDGLAYLPATALAGEIEAALDGLWRAHSGYNNFYNEPPYARILLKLVPNSGRVPLPVERKYVKVLTMCRIGNGYGVSEGATATYDELIGRWSERHVLHLLRLPVEDAEFNSRLQFEMCARNLSDLAADLRVRTPNKLVQRALDLLIASPPERMHRLRENGRYRQATQDL